MAKENCKHVILLILLALVLAACSNRNTPDDVTPPLPEEAAATQQPVEVPSAEDLIDDDMIIMPTHLDENGFVWRVLPTFEYSNIEYCGACSVFGTDHYESEIDTETCEISRPWYGVCGACNQFTSYYYDEKTELFYSYYADEGGGDFVTYSREMSPIYLHVFRKIDANKVVEHDSSGMVWYDLDKAYTSDKYALAYSTTFLTDFIYDDYRYDGGTASLAEVKLNDKWGVIDKDGNTVVPFCFEEILLIDEESAFAKYNGKYGIIDVYGKSSYNIPKQTFDNEFEAYLEKNFITTENVNLREGPSTDALRFLTVPKGKIVKVIFYGGWESVDYYNKNEEWYFVDYNGQKGYMKAEFLQEDTDEPAPEEVVEADEEVSEETADAPVIEPSVVLPTETADNPIAEPQEDYITINGKEYSTSITGLTLDGYSLKNEDIALLKHMTNLTKLYLYGEFSDLLGISSLANLSELVMYCHSVSDLAPLSALTNLTELRIYGKNIGDLTPLADLKNLTTLVVGYDKISDLSPLTGLENIESLTVWSNQISDLKPLSNLSKLNTLILERQNLVTDWLPVAHVPNLYLR
ncbi:MAG: SH3 domain-containing protein [Firmicutes bacterium]|nr:SH3 domain-containing protein [Bacillota bacterium]